MRRREERVLESAPILRRHHQRILARGVAQPRDLVLAQGHTGSPNRSLSSSIPRRRNAAEPERGRGKEKRRAGLPSPMTGRATARAEGGLVVVAGPTLAAGLQAGMPDGSPLDRDPAFQDLEQGWMTHRAIGPHRVHVGLVTKRHRSGASVPPGKNVISREPRHGLSQGRRRQPDPQHHPHTAGDPPAPSPHSHLSPHVSKNTLATWSHLAGSRPRAMPSTGKPPS